MPDPTDSTLEISTITAQMWTAGWNDWATTRELVNDTTAGGGLLIQHLDGLERASTVAESHPDGLVRLWGWNDGGYVVVRPDVAGRVERYHVSGVTPGAIPPSVESRPVEAFIYPALSWSAEDKQIAAAARQLMPMRLEVAETLDPVPTQFLRVR